MRVHRGCTHRKRGSESPTAVEGQRPKECSEGVGKWTLLGHVVQGLVDGSENAEPGQEQQSRPVAAERTTRCPEPADDSALPPASWRRQSTVGQTRNSG